MKKNILLILAIVGTISSAVFLYYLVKGDRNSMYFISSVIAMISAISIYILDNERFDVNKKKNISKIIIIIVVVAVIFTIIGITI